MLVSPVAIDPDSVRARRADPFAGHPDISVSIPAVIASAPVPAWMGAGTGVFDKDMRWSDLNIDALGEGRWKAEERSRGDEKEFLHRRGVFLSGENLHQVRLEIASAAAQPMEPGEGRRVAEKIFSQNGEFMVCGE